MKIFSIRISTALFIVLCLNCCSNPREKKKDSEVLKWIGKRINLIDSLQVYHPDNRQFTKFYDAVDIGKKKKLIVYIDGTCFTCAEDFVLWGDIVQSLKGKDVSLLFYLYINDLETMKPYFRKWRFNHPIIIDSQNTFYNINNLSIVKLYQAMLVDENNKVTIFGNPVYNEKIKQLYFDVIDGKSGY